MQKNDKFYTFLLSHKTRSKIYLRRVEVSRRLVHLGSLGIFAFIGISVFAAGVVGLSGGFGSFDGINDSIARAQIAPAKTQTEQSIDYSRPASPEQYAFNSGGPELPGSDQPDDPNLESELKKLSASMDPSYLPTLWSHLGKINNEYGFRRNPFGGRSYEFHGGMDIDGERGDMVVASANGTVIKAAYSGGYGNMIEIDHGNGLTTRYGHLSKIDVKEGDVVTRGQLIALIGSTGRSTGPHLHFELRLNDNPINPRFFLPPEPTDIKKL